MQYTQVSDYMKINALNERIGQLEQAHYSNEVYKVEARNIGDTATIEKLDAENAQLDKQWEPLVEERDRILTALEAANPNEGEGDNDRELRG